MVNKKGQRRETYHGKEEKEKEEILGRGGWSVRRMGEKGAPKGGGEGKERQIKKKKQSWTEN